MNLLCNFLFLIIVICMLVQVGGYDVDVGRTSQFDKNEEKVKQMCVDSAAEYEAEAKRLQADGNYIVAAWDYRTAAEYYERAGKIEKAMELYTLAIPGHEAYAKELQDRANHAAAELHYKYAAECREKSRGIKISNPKKDKEL